MYRKKLRVFLGGYLNYPNAQNINCYSLAKHLDKSKFKIKALSVYSRPNVKIKGVTIHRCAWPHSITVYWAYFWNIINADVVYLPKGELLAYNSFLCRLFKKKSFTTIEGILDDTNIIKAEQASGSKFLVYYHRLTKRYSITHFIRNYNLKRHQLISQSKALELGVEATNFSFKQKAMTPLKNVVLIAGNFQKKGIDDYLALASHFPSIKFHLIGEKTNLIYKKVKQNNLHNVEQHDYLSHKSFKNVLSKIQLHVLPSRSEGFPKVILETACAGIPSLVFDDYGASEWISNRKNGFVVNTLEEMKDIIDELLQNDQLLLKTSKAAIELGHSFDWKHKINDWEEVILALYNE